MHAHKQMHSCTHTFLKNISKASANVYDGFLALQQKLLKHSHMPSLEACSCGCVQTNMGANTVPHSQTAFFYVLVGKKGSGAIPTAIYF